MVGVRRFELRTSSSRTTRSARLSYTPRRRDGPRRRADRSTRVEAASRSATRSWRGSTRRVGRDRGLAGQGALGRCPAVVRMLQKADDPPGGAVLHFMTTDDWFWLL